MVHILFLRHTQLFLHFKQIKHYILNDKNSDDKLG